MTDELTGGLDLLGDWLDAKGYGEEAGLCTRVMDHMHKQEALIADWEFRHGNLSRHIEVLIDTLERQATRIAALEAENDELKTALRKWRIVLNQDGAAMEKKDG